MHNYITIIIISYTISQNAVFLVLCDKPYPRLLAFSFLTELQQSFWDQISPADVTAAVRPYAFIRFEPFIQNTKKRYLNTRSLRTPLDLVDLSAKIQTLPILKAQDILGAEFTAITGVNSYLNILFPMILLNNYSLFTHTFI